MPTEPRPAQPTAPSTPIRVLATWLAIFPLATVVLYAIAPIDASWPLLLRTFVLTAVVVPTAVILVVPRTTRLLTRLTARRDDTRTGA